MQKRNRQTNERIEEIIRTTGKENAKYLIEKLSCTIRKKEMFIFFEKQSL